MKPSWLESGHLSRTVGFEAAYTCVCATATEPLAPAGDSGCEDPCSGSGVTCGCMDLWATNYDPQATLNNGQCTYGCTELGAAASSPFVRCFIHDASSGWGMEGLASCHQGTEDSCGVYFDGGDRSLIQGQKTSASVIDALDGRLDIKASASSGPSDLTLRNVRLAHQYSNGAISITGSTLKLESCELESNSANSACPSDGGDKCYARNGAAISAKDSAIDASGTTFASNSRWTTAASRSSTEVSGASVTALPYVEDWRCSGDTISQTLVDELRAKDLACPPELQEPAFDIAEFGARFGGAIYAQETTIQLTANTMFRDNAATRSGGAIFVESSQSKAFGIRLGKFVGNHVTRRLSETPCSVGKDGKVCQNSGKPIGTEETACDCNCEATGYTGDNCEKSAAPAPAPVADGRRQLQFDFGTLTGASTPAPILDPDLSTTSEKIVGRRLGEQDVCEVASCSFGCLRRFGCKVEEYSSQVSASEWDDVPNANDVSNEYERYNGLDFCNDNGDSRGTPCSSSGTVLVKGCALTLPRPHMMVL